MNNGPKISAPATRRWLDENRQHRMDALDNSGVFAPNRQAFHRTRYEFAKKQVEGRGVADIACGLGYGSRILRHAGAKAVMGIDLCEDAIRYARSQHGLDGVTFMVADATQIPVADSSVDVITSFETIEHVPSAFGLLSEFIRILKPGGTVIVSSPNDWGLTEHHCHTWTAFEFMAEIAALFEIESVWEQNSDQGKPFRGIKCWSKETESEAECLIVVARKATNAAKRGAA